VRTTSVLLLALLVTACGGSKSTSASSTQTASVSIPPNVTTTPTTGTETTVTLTKTSATAPNTTTGGTTGAVNARVPARFTIQPGGSVTPPTITVPAHFAVELTVSSSGPAHRITLRTTALSVPAHGQATTRINGLRAGSYALKVDGAPKALLVIGGSPGP
jgi:hypothetical protein